MRTHPTIDELYSEIQKKHPSISKATVYRNMRQLADKGIILQIEAAKDAARYDGCTDLHHHFICDKCGRVFDLDIEFDDGCEGLAEVIEGKYKHKLDRCVTSFFGVCGECVTL